MTRKKNNNTLVALFINYYFFKTTQGIIHRKFKVLAKKIRYF